MMNRLSVCHAGRGFRCVPLRPLRSPRLQFVLAGMFCGGLMFAASPALSQKTTSPPPTDTSAQSSPLPSEKPAPKAPVVDASTQSSPISEPKAGGISLAPHTAIPVALGQALDSGKLKNGQTIPAKLSATVTARGKTFPAGTHVELTVVETVPAGRMYEVGEISLQVLSVGGTTATTDTLTFRGKPGQRLTADAVPSKGTDASLASGTQLTFHVLAPPEPATAPPPNSPNPPGSVNEPPKGKE